MIFENNYPDNTWSLVIKNTTIDFFIKFLTKFEEKTKPNDQKISLWHDTIAEYSVEEFENKKIQILYIDDLMVITFTNPSDSLSNKKLKRVIEDVYQNCIK